MNATESVNVNGGSVNVMTDGVGNAGNLTVQARNAVNVTHGGSLLLFSAGRGSTGNLRIETGTLRVQNGEAGGVRAINAGSGSVGSISIQARHAVEVIDGVIFVQVKPKGVGLAGDVIIETQRVNLRDGGRVNTDTFSSANAGNIVIRASESVDIRGISNDTLTGMFPSNVSSQTDGGTGNGGNVTIETPRLTLSEGGNVMTTSTSSQGNAGNITIRAKDVNLDGFINVPIERLSEQLQQPNSSLAAALSELNKGNLSFLNELNKGSWSVLSQLSSEVIRSDADVRGGTITVDTERLRLSNGANLAASVIGGRGQGGNLVVRATDSIEITGVGGKRANGLPFQSGLFAQLQTGGIGSGGSINVETGRLNMSNDGEISTSTFNQGNAGDITIRAAQIDLSGQNIIITTAVEDEARGNAGNLSISTQGLNVRDGAQVISATLGKGNAGNLTIQANAIELTGAYSGLFSSVDTGADGKGGNLSITSDRLSIRNGGTVAASTGLGSTGQGGNLTINASDWVEVAGISNDGLLQSFLSVRSRGEGQAGNITVNSPRISVKDKGVINAESFAADGGNITLNTNLLLLRHGGTISATAGNQEAGGNGGNITINTRAIVAVPKEDSDIRANAFQGRGGNITINTDALFGIAPSRIPTSQSDITASSDLGVAGVINLIAPDNSALQNSFSDLPQNSIDTNALIANSCIGRTKSKEGTFTITGSGGLPNRPGDVSASLYSTGDVRGIIPSTSTSWKKGDPIVEPTGVYRLGNGRLVMSRECV